MKKLLSFLIAVVSTFTFSGCIITFHDNYQPSQEVAQIENIYVYEIEEAIYYYNYYTDNSIFPAHFAVLESSDFAALIQDMEGILYRNSLLVFPPAAQDPNLYYDGYVVKVEYQDGGYDMVSSSLRTSCDVEKKDRIKTDAGSCDAKIFLSTLQKYVDIQEE